MPDHLCDPYAVEFIGKPPDRAKATCCGRKWYLTKKGWSDTPPANEETQRSPTRHPGPRRQRTRMSSPVRGGLRGCGGRRRVVV